MRDLRAALPERTRQVRARAKSRASTSFCCDALESRVLLAASLLKDINTATPPSDPSAFVDLAGTLLFRANDGVHGEDWWRSDGTAEGTTIVKDLAVSAGDTPFSSPRTTAVIGTTMYFGGRNASTGAGLWKTDGTDAGTTLVKGLVAGAAGGLPAFFVPDGQTLYFSAADALWKSDGTEAGTVVVTQFDAGADPKPLAMLGGRLLFQAPGPGGGAELWSTDGSPAGTSLLMDINPGAAASEPGYTPSPAWPEDQKDRFLVDGNRMYFAATTAANGRELWQTDGTAEGTHLAADLVPGTSGSLLSFIAAHAGAIYAVAFTSLTQPKVGVFRVNPDVAGATLVGSTPDIFPLALAGAGDKLLYLSYGTAADRSRPILHVVSETGTGLTEIARFGSGMQGAAVARFGGATYFSVGYTGGGGGAARPSGTELWRTDGTTQGTTRVAVFRATTNGTSTTFLQPVGQTLYLVGNGQAGAEPWRSDGTAEGTRLLRDVNASRTFGSDPTPAVAVNGRWLFSADDGVSGRGLWSTDGTDAGTSPVVDPATGRPFPVRTQQWVEGWPVPTVGTAWNGRLYFAGGQSSSPGSTKLYVSDGTGGGTKILTELDGGRCSNPHDFFPFNGRLYFFADDYGAPAPDYLTRVLWSTDGTPAGTRIVKRMGGDQFRQSAYFTALGDSLYFLGYSNGNGLELWKTDGTEQGTALVRDINAGPGDAEIYGLVAYHGALYFGARDATGRGLWRSDGTAAGTVSVWEADPGFGNGDPRNLAVVNDRLLFEAISTVDLGNGTFGQRTGVWSTDGTRAGTVPLTPPSFSEDLIAPLNLMEAGGVGYFFRQRLDAPAEMWRTDGTPAGTRVLKVFDTAGSPPLAAAVGTSGSTVYVCAGPLDYVPGQTASGAVELWATDGTDAGTTRLFSAPTGSVPRNAANANGRILFTNGDRAYGNEMWVVPPAAAVVERHVFYNHSAFDGNSGEPNAADDGAIATDKAALLPGQGLGGFANVTSFSRGINGVMIDVSGGLPLTALAGIGGSVGLKVGTGADPSAWADAPRPSQLTIRRGAGLGGSDRITLTWPDGAIRNTWLRVTVNAVPQSGLDRTDVFYFGNLVGETGDGASLSVGAGDLVAVRASSGLRQGLDGRHDLNRDGRVNAADLSLARGNLTRRLSHITGGASPVAAAAVPDPRRASGARSRYTGVTEFLRHAATD